MAQQELKEADLKNFDVLILGGGSFGTALGNILATRRKKVLLWVRYAKQACEINQNHVNSDYFPKTKLSPHLKASTDLEKCLPFAKLIIMAIPSKAFRQVARSMKSYVSQDQTLVHVTKGIEEETYQRMSEILREETCLLKIGVLSGPNLAKELIIHDPAGALIASEYDEVITSTQEAFHGTCLRVYSSHDVIGTEIGGAFKNIIALISGAAHGMGFGDNTKALIITRGLMEMAKYGLSLGANLETFWGLAGMGDLMATCNSPLSRNHQVGYRLAQGESLSQIIQDSHQVAEGVSTTLAVYSQALKIGLKLPMVEAVYQTLYEKACPQKMLKKLMERPTGLEGLSSLKELTNNI